MGISARSTRGVFWICSVSLVSAAIDAGCGSDSFTSSESTDGGSDSDVASGDSAASEGGVVGCISPPPGPAIDAAFCSAFAAISSRCNACADCQKENAASCATFGDQLSIPFRNAIVACSDEIDCAAFETQVQLVQDPCVAAYVFDAGPSSYQLAAKTAYCDNCADASVNGAQNCASFFGQPDASGIGTVVLFGSDIVSGDIANGCPFCDGLFYPSCEIGKLCNGVPKDQCGKGLCK